MTLLRRAADWHLSHDDPEAAARYLIEAQDWDRVLDLIDRYARPMFEASAASVVVHWLDALPANVRSARHLMLARAGLHAMVGNYNVTEEVLRDFGTRSMSAGERVVADMLHAIGIQNHLLPKLAIDSADAVATGLAALPASSVPDVLGLTEPSMMRFAAECSRGRALWYLGDVEQARATLADLCEQPYGYPPYVVHALGSLALLESWAGYLSRAEKYVTRALDMTTELGLESHPSSIDAYLAMATVLRERNHLARSALALDTALSLAGRVHRAASLAIGAAERALLHLAASQTAQGLEEIRNWQTLGAPSLPGILGDRLIEAEARLLLAAGDHGRADEVLQSATTSSAALAAVAVQVALARGDVEEARVRLASWPDDPGLRSSLDRALWSAIAEYTDGQRRKAIRNMADAVALAERENHIRLFLDAGDGSMRLLRSLYHMAPAPYLRLLVEPDASEDRSLGLGEHLVEPLSEREAQIVRFLPTRLSSAEIARELFVSVNTLKTHLRSIYRKLGVTERREAVEVAERLGLA
jgi:LuxR family maltose regulon positive regulatory protein